VFEICEKDKLKLDVIERLGNGYADRTITIPGFGNCSTYVAEDSHIDNNLQPYDWYREMVLLGCQRLGFPVAYRLQISQTVANIDPHPGRRKKNLQIVRMLQNERF